MSIFRKVAATVIGTRIAADTGKSSGVLGLVAGMAATRIIARSPMGALLLGGGYVAHKLLKKKREIDAFGPHATATKDGLSAPEANSLPNGAAAHPLPTAQGAPAVSDARLKV
ncbi:hypothetical protein [Sphingobium algorifonticola]|uniref:Uncharacterized protein n=1 Tax=Sphingobium algorifonticola TaxID=2008318 RepID=A0A437JD80_9SPHN|nr:hypothetical protein [Sphingobium algorifonticola]RVT43879.1 hypothetical protein ENE74_04655 [Sphingobium algorifonticola]